jgi:hypothetical protein
MSPSDHPIQYDLSGEPASSSDNASSYDLSGGDQIPRTVSIEESSAVPEEENVGKYDLGADVPVPDAKPTKKFWKNPAPRKMTDAIDLSGKSLVDKVKFWKKEEENAESAESAEEKAEKEKVQLVEKVKFWKRKEQEKTEGYEESAQEKPESAANEQVQKKKWNVFGKKKNGQEVSEQAQESSKEPALVDSN